MIVNYHVADMSRATVVNMYRHLLIAWPALYEKKHAMFYIVLGLKHCKIFRVCRRVTTRKQVYDHRIHAGTLGRWVFEVGFLIRCTYRKTLPVILPREAP